MENIKIRYIRNGRVPIGCVVTSLEKNKLGWSLCHKNDKFSKKKAREIAMMRLTPIPDIVVRDIMRDLHEQSRRNARRKRENDKKRKI